jgi:hypothetical protein
VLGLPWRDLHVGPVQPLADRGRQRRHVDVECVRSLIGRHAMYLTV